MVQSENLNNLVRDKMIERIVAGPDGMPVIEFDDGSELEVKPLPGGQGIVFTFDLFFETTFEGL